MFPEIEETGSVTGAALLASTQTFTAGNTFTIGSGGNAVALAVNQDDTTNNPQAVTIANTGTGVSLQVTPTGNTAASYSVGGAINLNNTSNTGSGMVLYTNHGSGTTGRLFYVSNDNAAHDREIAYIQSASNTNTALAIASHVNGQGTVKITHIADTGSAADANSSGISIDLQGSSGSSMTTAAQGIFITSTTGGTTGPLMQLKNDLTAFGGSSGQVDLFYVKGDGHIGIQKISSPTAWLHIGAGTATAGTAPLKINSGTNLTSPEDGAFEYDGTHLYFTIGSTRHTLI